MIDFEQIKREQENRGITPSWGGSRECMVRAHLMHMVWALARDGWMGKEGGDAAIERADRVAQEKVGIFHVQQHDRPGPPYKDCFDCWRYQSAGLGKDVPNPALEPPRYWRDLWSAVKNLWWALVGA